LRAAADVGGGRHRLRVPLPAIRDSQLPPEKHATKSNLVSVGVAARAVRVAT
jgi:hypothetical protein